MLIQLRLIDINGNALKIKDVTPKLKAWKPSASRAENNYFLMHYLGDRYDEMIKLFKRDCGCLELSLWENHILAASSGFVAAKNKLVYKNNALIDIDTLDIDFFNY